MTHALTIFNGLMPGKLVACWDAGGRTPCLESQAAESGKEALSGKPRRGC